MKVFLAPIKQEDSKEVVVKLGFDMQLTESSLESDLYNMLQERCSEAGLERRIEKGDQSAAISARFAEEETMKVVTLTGHPAFIRDTLESFYNDVRKGDDGRAFVDGLYAQLNQDLSNRVVTWEKDNAKDALQVTAQELSPSHQKAFARVKEVNDLLDKEKHFKDLRNFLRGVESKKLSEYVRFHDGKESFSIFDPSGGPLRNLSEMEMVVKDWTEAPSNLEQIMNYFKTGAIEPSPEIKSEARQQASPVVANPVAQQALKVFGVALKPTGRDLSN